ncbi:ribbon-helix-helix protein, CopG family [Chlorobium sp. N1]|uniref:CopG family ribbon-helix-helix protein n=1 Tax=Chlorobium sp. N1 TaxID=2491138 RepID=UPI00103F7151|nr:ribbon-helix-helix protein, CopG family [Chlorobium sp. N1]TCD47986.1 ribbon-helix-helix protein, CopG family [Chlorobium sp. N1]
MKTSPKRKAERNQLSLKIDADTKQRIELLASATQRTKTFVIEEAINQYLSLNEWQIESIQRGLADSRAGNTIAHEDLMKEWEDD